MPENREAHNQQLARHSLPTWAAIGLYSLIVIISIAYGFQYIFQTDKALHVTYFRWMVLPFLGVLLVLSGLALRRWEPGVVELPRWLGFVLMSISLLMTLYFYSASIKPVPWPLLGVAVVTVAGLFHYHWGARASASIFAVIGLVLYIALVIKVPHTQGANMLQIVEAAAQDFLRGVDPYHFYAGIAKERFGYLPGLWLPYSVFVAAGLDVRILNFICLLLIVWIFEKGLALGANKALVLSVVLYPILLSPPIAQMVIHGHVWPFWALLLGAMLMLFKKNYLAAAILLGLAVAARQTSLLLLGPLAVYLFLQLGLARFAKYTAIAIAAYLVVILPFSLWTGKEFWALTYLTMSSASGELYLVLAQISMAGWMQWMGLENALKYFQVLILLFWMAIIYFRKPADFSWFLFVTGITYIWLVLFNPYVVRYVYLPGIFLLSMALAIRLGVFTQKNKSNK